MGKVRKHAPHVRWSSEEIHILKQHYATMSWSDLESLLPIRTSRIIQCKANGLGLVRFKSAKMTPEEVRASKRESMARRWRENPEKMREYARANHAKNREVRNERLRLVSSRRFFWSRANRFKGITARDLASLWRHQRGRCAYTEQKLDRSAHIDHILPRALGGGDELLNLQWVCPEVNYAKRDLTHDQFLELCGSVMRWLGERIQMVEDLCNPKGEVIHGNPK